MMAKLKVYFTCTECGAQYPKWAGQCSECMAWNSLIEEVVSPGTSFSETSKHIQSSPIVCTCLSDIKQQDSQRIPTGSLELDRVLGGGLVVGSAVLIGGDPGVGKSTLLLQTLAAMSHHHPVLYVSGEESLQQTALRAQRLTLASKQLKILTETHLERILSAITQEHPHVVVIDSIQTMFSDELQSSPGSVSQVRECTAKLIQLAKQTHTAVWIIGHVTKEGNIAGPRVLEHMVDTVLYFEGNGYERFRILRAVKNRFGAVNEIGIFAMLDKGLKEVPNPSAIFLTRPPKPAPGSAVMVTWEGSRPLLVEIQALVDQTRMMNPKRLAVGFDPNRLSMLLAILHRHCHLATFDQDVFVNIVGGVRVAEPAMDLAALMAIISSLRDKPLPKDLIIFGEVGLAGEVRPVQNGQERLKEAIKHGFKRALIPAANKPSKKDAFNALEIHAVHYLPEAIPFA